MRLAAKCQAQDGSGSHLFEALNNMTLVPCRDKLYSIALQDDEIEAEWPSVLSDFECVTGTSLNESQAENKLKEFKRMNRVFKVLVIDANAQDFSLVKSQRILHSLFSTYHNLMSRLITVTPNRSPLLLPMQ